MIRKASCKCCALEGKVRGWFFTPNGYYCPACAEAFPSEALAVSTLIGNESDREKMVRKIRDLDRTYESRAQQRRAFLIAIGNPEPPAPIAYSLASRRYYERV